MSYHIVLTWLHFGSKKTGKISIIFEHLWRNSVLFRNKVKPLVLTSITAIGIVDEDSTVVMAPDVALKGHNIANCRAGVFILIVFEEKGVIHFL